MVFCISLYGGPEGRPHTRLNIPGQNVGTSAWTVRCKEVYRYPHNNYYFPLLVVALFLAESSLFLCLFLNVFSFLFMLFLCNVIIKNC